MGKSSDVFEKRFGQTDALFAILKWPINQALHRLSKRHLKSKRRQLAVFAFDHIAHRININGVYELDELDAFFGWLSQVDRDAFEGIAVDVGANIGNHSLYFSDYFAEVLSFEPNSRTFRLLSINAELVPNVRAFNVGLSNRKREARLRVNLENMGGARVTDEAGGASEVVTLDTLDSLVGGGTRVRLMKIDVEGHEVEVLMGAEQVVRRDKPIILFEQHKTDFADGSSKVVSLLRAFGYSQFVKIVREPATTLGEASLLRSAVAAAKSLALGSAMRVVCEDSFAPGFYPFIAAIPDWLRIDVPAES